jgi:hypothetical protein
MGVVEREKGPTGSPWSVAIRAMVTAVKAFDIGRAGNGLRVFGSRDWLNCRNNPRIEVKCDWEFPL